MFNKKFVLKLTTMLTFAFCTIVNASATEIMPPSFINEELKERLSFNAFYNIGRPFVSQFSNSIDSDRHVIIVNPVLYGTSFTGGGLAIGYHYQGVNFELEGLYNNIPSAANADANKLFNSFDYKAAVANVKTIIEINHRVLIPFTSFGIGIAKTNFSQGQDELHSFPFLMQAKYGMAFKTATQFTPYVAYKLVFIFPKKLSSIVSENIKTNTTVGTLLTPNKNASPAYVLHALEAGISFSF